MVGFFSVVNLQINLCVYIAVLHFLYVSRTQSLNKTAADTGLLDGCTCETQPIRALKEPYGVPTCAPEEQRGGVSFGKWEMKKETETKCKEDLREQTCCLG